MPVNLRRYQAPLNEDALERMRRLAAQNEAEAGAAIAETATFNEASRVKPKVMTGKVFPETAPKTTAGTVQAAAQITPVMNQAAGETGLQPPPTALGSGQAQTSASGATPFEPESGQGYSKGTYGGMDWAKLGRALQTIGATMSDTSTALQGPGRQTSRLAELEESRRQEAQTQLQEKQAGFQERLAARQEAQMAMQAENQRFDRDMKGLQVVEAYTPYLQSLPEEQRGRAKERLIQQFKDSQFLPLIEGRLNGESHASGMFTEYGGIITRNAVELKPALSAATQFYEKNPAEARKLMEAAIQPYLIRELGEALPRIVEGLKRSGQAVTTSNVYLALTGADPLYATTLMTDKDGRFDGYFDVYGLKSPRLDRELRTKTAEARAERETPEELAAKKRAEIPVKVEEQAALLPGRVQEAERLEAIKAKYAEVGAVAKSAKEIRNDFLGLPTVRTMQQAAGVLGQMEGVFRGPHTAASDYSLVMGFAKINDPDSAAREGEQAAARATAARNEQFNSWYNLALRKESLPPESRAKLMDAARRAVQGRREAYLPIEKNSWGLPNGRVSRTCEMPCQICLVRSALEQTPNRSITRSEVNSNGKVSQKTRPSAGRLNK